MSFTEADKELEERYDLKVQYGRPRIKDEIRNLVTKLHNEGLSVRKIRSKLLARGIGISVGSVHNIISEQAVRKRC